MKIGDVVRLPSGSGAMAVVRVGDEEIEVCWMGYNDHLLHTAVMPKNIFKPGNIEKTTQETPPWT